MSASEQRTIQHLLDREAALMTEIDTLRHCGIDPACRLQLAEAVALLDSALRTINAIATTAGYAYRAPNTVRTAALDDIRLTAGTFKGGDGHKAENFLARFDGAGGGK